MKKMKNSTLFQTIAAISGTLLLAGAVFFAAHPNILSLTPLAATNARVVNLNSSNSPILSNGSGTIVDSRGVVWEYYNASDYSQGHITLNHQGYFGVSVSSPYGITGTTDITANFSAGQNSELWLLKSVDGITWGEDCILESNSAVASANNWRYVRFYNYSTDASSVNINSIQMNYSCSGISATEDVDSAKASNVIATSSNLTYSAEYSDVSPNSIGGEAVRFEKIDTGNTDLTLGFGHTYRVGPTQNAKVEFDMKTSNINYGKSITLINNGSTLGSTIYSNKGTSYKCENIQDDWYHIEVPITTFISTISGYNGKDKPHTGVENKEYNAIKINAGNCVIDNLRLTSTQCDLGIFNNPTYKPSVGEAFWLKVSWVGKLYPEQVAMSFSDNTLARRIPLDDPLLTNGSPFYIELLGSGTLTITCTVVSGYNRTVHSIQHTITIN